MILFFSEILTWRISNFVGNRQVLNLPILFHALSHYVEALTVAKFKNFQCILMTGLPNLMLTKVSCYAVL